MDYFFDTTLDPSQTLNEFNNNIFKNVGFTLERLVVKAKTEVSKQEIKLITIMPNVHILEILTKKLS